MKRGEGYGGWRYPSNVLANQNHLLLGYPSAPPMTTRRWRYVVKQSALSVRVDLLRQLGWRRLERVGYLCQPPSKELGPAATDNEEDGRWDILSRIVIAPNRARVEENSDSRKNNSTQTAIWMSAFSSHALLYLPGVLVNIMCFRGGDSRACKGSYHNWGCCVYIASGGEEAQHVSVIVY